MKRATPSCASAAALALVLACVAACDGLGRAVVDHEPLPPVIPPAELADCFEMQCEEPILELELPSSVVTGLHRPDLSFCGTEHDACALAAKAPEIDDTGCRNGVLRDPRVLDGESVYCGDLSLPMADEAGECAARVEGLVVERGVVRIQSERACELELPGLVARDVRIELSGPVTLVIGERAELKDAAFVGVRTTDGAPLLEIDLSVAERTVIGDDEAPFEGMVSLRRSSLEDSSLRAEEVALESTVFLRAQVHADLMDAVDAVFAAALLDFGSALIAGSSFDRAEIRSCRALLITGSVVYNAVLRGCGDELLRIYNSTVGRSILNGRLELDSANVEFVQLGMHGTTELVQFGGIINKAAVCEQVSSYRPGALADATCFTCVEHALDEGGACALSDDVGVVVSAALCEAVADVEMCEGEDLMRQRPPTPARLPMP
jgi:hypothetical protein